MPNLAAEAEEFPVLDTEIVLETIYSLIKMLALLAYTSEHENPTIRAAAIRFVAKTLDPDLAVGFEEMRQSFLNTRNEMPDVLN